MTCGGGYRLVEVELDELAGQVVELGPEEGGVGLVLRDRGHIVGFELCPKEQVTATKGVLSSLVPEHVKVATTASRLRDALRVTGSPDPRLTVAICTKDRPDWLARLVRSLLPLQGEIPFELLVIDNAPSDERTKQFCAETSGVTYVREPVPGLNFARNRALAEASGEVLAFLDDDVVVDRGWLAGLLQAWCDHPDAGAITGLVMPLRLNTEAQILFERRGGFRRGFRPLRYGSTAFRSPMHPCGAGQFGAGANMSLRTRLVRELGGFDEALDTGKPLPGGGDLDIFYRVLRSGAVLAYEPRMAVFHDHREELPVLARQYYTWGLGFSAFASKTKSADRAARGPMNEMIRWWFVDQGRRLVSSIAGRGDTPVSMIVGELRGGIVGLLGEYGRSQRRSHMAKVRTE